MRGSSSMAQLSAWTDTMRKSQSEKVDHLYKSEEQDEDEYNDAYEEEFEEFEEEPEPKNIAPAKSTIEPSKETKSREASYKESRDSKAGRFGQEYSTPKATDSFSHSLARSIADPRTVRIQRVLNSGILNLQVEKFTILNLPQTPAYDFYLSEIRSSQAKVRQIGVPHDVEYRDIDVATDDIYFDSKEIQFCYGDDTLFYRKLSSIEKKKRNEHSVSDDYFRQTSLIDNERVFGLSNLSAFLDQSSGIIASLLGSRKSSNSKGADSEEIIGKDWTQLGKESRTGSIELIRDRKSVQVKFSLLNPSILLTVHPYPTDSSADHDLKPNKGLVCVWQVNDANGPFFVLELASQPISSCFSNAQSFYIFTGAEDGTVALWDLRESNSLHKDKDSVDLKLVNGIRKPSFCTTIRYGEESLDQDIHNSGVSQVECLDSTASTQNGTSLAQFVSLDEDGILLFWITSQVNRDSESDLSLHLRRGSRVALIKTKKIDLTQEMARCLSRKLKMFHGANSVVHCSADDPSAVLYVCGQEVFRISRSGQVLQPARYLPFDNQNSTESKKWFSEISAIASFICDGFRCSLFITGRSDGKVELYCLKHEFPVISWSLSSFLPDSSLAAGGVLSIFTLRNTVIFFVISTTGWMYEFNLLINLQRPIRSQKLARSLPRTSRLISLSEFRREEGKLAITSSDETTFTIGSINQLNRMKTITEQEFNDFISTFKNNQP